MARNAGWKQFERRASRYFGVERTPGSGNRSGRDDVTPGDSTHERLHIESKLRDKHTIFRLWDDARAAEAKAGTKRPVVICLQEGGRPGFIVACHTQDIPAAVVEWLAGRTFEELQEIQEAVRRRREGDVT